MNANRRKRLQTIIRQADILLEQLQAIQDEEQDAVDNMPESLQYTDRYLDMEQAAEALGDAANTMSELIDSLEGIL